MMLIEFAGTATAVESTLLEWIDLRTFGDENRSADSTAGTDDRSARYADELAEQLACEKGRIRLYDALIGKSELSRFWCGLPAEEDLRAIRETALRHATLCEEALAEIDPDASVRAAVDPATCAAECAAQHVAEPHAPVHGACKAAFFAELAADAGWASLAEHARERGELERAARFDAALLEDAHRLQVVYRWLERAARRATRA
jgi:hypothetical protein